MDFEPAVPKDAASLIVLDSSGEKILWARRNHNLKFLGGFHSFPGGKVDVDDRECNVKNAEDVDQAELIACAVREAFEEIGVLLVRNGDRLTKGQLPLLHDDLESGRSTFSGILDHWGLWIDADDFEFAGVWTTPEFSQVRFRTSFYVVKCPAKQEPYAAITELQEIEFVEAGVALEKWSKSEVLIAPPVLSSLQALTEIEKPVNDLVQLASAFAEHAAAHDDGPHIIELNSRLVCFPVRTKTLPPATHTNCFVVGGKNFVVIDAATPFEDEQRKLNEYVLELIKDGNHCEAIIVSHLHPDHFGGETALRKQIFDQFEIDVPIVGHHITIHSLADKVKFDNETKDTYRLQDSNGDSFELDVIHTPGHARGHLCFFDRDFGFLLSSDNVVGQGTVVIAPPEGNMSDYLRSLEEMKSLPGLRSLAGSHGAAVSDAVTKIDQYIEHRLKRERQVLDAIKNGAQEIDKIVKKIYPDLDQILIPLAGKSVEAHIEKLVSDNKLAEAWRESAAPGI